MDIHTGYLVMVQMFAWKRRQGLLETIKCKVKDSLKYNVYREYLSLPQLPPTACSWVPWLLSNLKCKKDLALLHGVAL